MNDHDLVEDGRAVIALWEELDRRMRIVARLHARSSPYDGHAGRLTRKTVSDNLHDAFFRFAGCVEKLPSDPEAK